MSKRVLIIDRDETFCQSITQALEPLGLDVMSFQESSPGMTYAEKYDPELIIWSAEVQAYSLSRKLRKDTSGKLIITSEVTNDNATKSLERHKNGASAANVYLIKPVAESDVIHQVNQLLDLGLNPQLFGDSLLDPQLDNLNFGHNAPDSPAAGPSHHHDLENQDQQINYLKKEMEAYREGYKTLENSLKSKKDKLSEAESRVTELEDRLSELQNLEEQAGNRKAELKQVEQMLNRKDTTLAETEAENHRLSGEIARISHELEQSAKLLRQTQSSEASGVDQLGDLTRDNQSLMSKLEEQKRNRKLVEEELRASEAARSTIESTSEGFRKELENNRRQLRQRDEQTTNQEEKVNQLKDRNQELSSRIKDLDGKLNSNDNALQRERQDIKLAISETASLRNEMQGMQDMLDDSHREREKLEVELNIIKDNLKRRDGESHEWEKDKIAHQRLQDEAQEKYQALKTQMEEATRRLENQESTITTIENELKKAQEDTETNKRRKEALQKNLDEVTQETRKTVEKLRKEMLEQKAAFDDARTALDRENETMVRNLKEELAKARREAEARVSELTTEKADQVEQMRQALRQLKADAEKAQGEAHSQKEETFSLNKKLRQLEENHQSELQKLRSNHETESGRRKLEREEEIKSLKAENERAVDELNKQITAMTRSNKEYESRVTQLENKLSLTEKEYEAERSALALRLGDLENKRENLAQSLSREKEELQASKAKAKELSSQIPFMEETHAKNMSEQQRHHETVLNGEKMRITTLQERIGRLELELAALNQVKLNNGILKRDLEKLRLSHEMLKSRQTSAISSLTTALQDLQGASESLTLEE